jgi:hypothetical protein
MKNEMDYEEMLQKVSPMHNDQMRRMFGLNELPEALLRRYFAYKMILDKIDAPIRPLDLLTIAIAVGFDLDTQRFLTGEEGIERAELKPVEEVTQPEKFESHKPTALQQQMRERISEVAKTGSRDEIIAEVEEIVIAPANDGEPETIGMPSFVAEQEKENNSQREVLEKTAAEGGTVEEVIDKPAENAATKPEFIPRLTEVPCFLSDGETATGKIQKSWLDKDTGKKMYIVRVKGTDHTLEETDIDY